MFQDHGKERFDCVRCFNTSEDNASGGIFFIFNKSIIAILMVARCNGATCSHIEPQLDGRTAISVCRADLLTIVFRAPCTHIRSNRKDIRDRLGHMANRIHFREMKHFQWKCMKVALLY
jgi:hypothetical protein